MKESYYFSHDYNPTSDPKIQALLGCYGSLGYAIFWRIVEMLHENEDHKLPLKKYLFIAIAKQMLTDAKQVESLLNEMIEDFELFDSDSEFFWSNRVLRNFEKRNEISEKRSISGKIGAEVKKMKANAKQIQASAKQNLANQSKGKERKEKEIKGNEIKESITHTPEIFEPTKENLNLLKQQGLMKGISESEINAFVVNMEGNGWMNARGNNLYPFKDLQQVFKKMWDWKTSGILEERAKKMKKNGVYTNSQTDEPNERFTVIETPTGWDYQAVKSN